MHTNARRAKRVIRLLAVQYPDHDMTDPDEMIEAMTDLLADIRHACDQQGTDFDRVVEQSRQHYLNELDV